MSTKWSSGVCECSKDPTLALLFCICPPFVSAQTAEKLGGDFVTAFLKACCCSCFPCLAASDRRRLRDKYDLPPEPCGDLMVHCCIGCCATCQEAREVAFRQGAVADKPQQTQMVAVQPQTMTMPS